MCGIKEFLILLSSIQYAMKKIIKQIINSSRRTRRFPSRHHHTLSKDHLLKDDINLLKSSLNSEFYWDTLYKDK